MKKIVFIIFAVICSIFLGSKASAETMQFYEDNWVASSYIIKNQPGNKRYEQIRFIRPKGTTEFVYCLDPNAPFSDNNIYSGTNENVLNIPKDIWERINLIAYYGYGYDGHIENKWYAVTQVMIWQLVANYEIYFTNTLNGARNDSLFVSEMAEINQLITKYYTLPNLGETTFNLKLGDELTLYDYNEVISYYNLENPDGLEHTININGNLNIFAENIGTYKLILRRHISRNGISTLFINDPYQPILYNSQFNFPYLEILINIEGVTTEIVKIDSETKNNIPQEDASLNGALYELYDDNDNFIEELKTNENGHAKTSAELGYGTYYFKEKKASYGYNLDLAKHYFTIDKNNLLIKLFLEEEIIKKEVRICKVIASDKTGMMNSEIGIKFNVYSIKSQELVATVNTDENGCINLNLPYGKYLVVQETTFDGYEKAEPFVITVNENTKEKLTMIVANAKIPEEPTVEIEVPNTKSDLKINFIIAIGLIIVLLLIIFHKKIKKCYKIFGYLFLLAIIITVITDPIVLLAKNKIDEVKIQNYIDTDFYSETSEKISDNKSILAIIEIPKISLKHYLYKDIFSNNVERNIAVIYSDKTVFTDGITVLAAHSGSGINAYFNHIDKLNLQDIINVYFAGKKYIYRIDEYYITEKNGKLILPTTNTKLYLTTCDKNDDKKQLIIGAALVSEINTNEV